LNRERTGAERRVRVCRSATLGEPAARRTSVDRRDHARRATDRRRAWRPAGGAAPFEIYFGREPAHEKPRTEPRARYPTKPGERLRAKRGAKVLLEVTYLGGEKHLPVVAIKAA
jgi:hypothetical protein